MYTQAHICTILCTYMCSYIYIHTTPHKLDTTNTKAVVGVCSS